MNHDDNNVQYYLFLKGGKTKIPFPIYFEEAKPPSAGVPENVIEKEQVS